MDRQHEAELSLGELFSHLKDRLWIIAAACAVCGLLGFLISGFLISPQYSAATRMYVLNRASESAVAYTDIQTSTQLSNDYQVLITGRNVTEAVIEQLALDTTAEALASRISVFIPDNTRVVQISVTDKDPEMAAAIANAVREAAAAQIRQITNMDAVSLVYEAKAPVSPSYPNIPRWALLSAILGAVAAAGSLSVRYVLDDTLRTEADVERYLGLSVLSVIPDPAELAPADKQKGRTRLWTRSR